MVPVQTAISDGRWMEITSGLSGDDDVVVVGKRKLVENSSVSPAPFNLPEGKSAIQKFERRSPDLRPPALDFRNSNAQESEIAREYLTIRS